MSNVGRAWVTRWELNQLIGVDRGQVFFDKYAGKRLYVPRKAEGNHPIALLIGDDAARDLCKKYGGGNIELPSPAKWNTIRKTVFEMLQKGGKTNEQIAHEMGCGIRYIEKLVAEFREIQKAPKQGTLV